MRKFGAPMAAAFKRTIADYDELIADPEGQAAKWTKWGGHAGCRLCRAAHYHPEEDVEAPVNVSACKRCPISCGKPTGCCEVNSDEDETGYSALWDILVAGNPEGDAETHYDDLRAAAVARRAWLVKTAAEAGLELDG